MGWDLHYWRSTAKAEVDFVIIHANSIIGVEVKAGRLKKKSLSRSARSFIEAYRPSEFIVLNWTLDEEMKVGETPIKYIPLTNLPYWLETHTKINLKAV